jgi:hypothetical protein
VEGAHGGYSGAFCVSGKTVLKHTNRNEYDAKTKQ